MYSCEGPLTLQTETDKNKGVPAVTGQDQKW